MPELYHFNDSVCAQRVRVVLAEKGLEWVPHQAAAVDPDGEQVEVLVAALVVREQKGRVVGEHEAGDSARSL